MVATSRVASPAAPTPAELLERSRQLVLMGFPTEAASCCRTALETATFELCCRHGVSSRRVGLLAWLMALAKHLQIGKRRRGNLRRAVTIGNMASHAVPISTADCVQMIFAVTPFIERHSRKGVHRDSA